MSSPIIEQVRTIPLIVEKDYAHNRDNLIPMEADEIDEISGFPFDDDFDSRRDRDGNLRSHLDDITQRHPELAEHLHSFRNRGTDHPFYQRAGYADRPFGSRFDRYFPFDDRFDVEPEEYRQFYQSRPDYYPEFHQQQQQQNSSAAEEQKQNSEAKSAAEPEQKQEENNSTVSSDKGRNLQQSNTVDLGKEQEPVNDRQQRSMSAPPPENRPRYRSHINIPINREVGNDNQQQQSQQQPQQSQQQPPQQQQQQQNRPAERVIPIHVEGRDEPIIPRNVHATFTSAPPPPQYQHHHPQPQQRQQQQQQQQPQAERIFGQRPEMFTQFVSPGFGRQNDDIFRQQQQQYQREQEQKYRQQQEEAARQQQQQQQQQSQTQNQNQKPPEAPKAAPFSPIDQIKAIQKDVSDLMTQVEQFSGSLRDKQYLYLEEMLTRQILKLDDIDAQGQENIRSARKDSIRCIEATLSLLESRAKANAAGKSDAQQQQQQQQEDNKMEVEQQEATSSNENQQQQQKEGDKMETDTSEKPSVESMEVVVPEEQKNTENRAVLVTNTDNDNNNKAPPTTESSQSQTGNENEKKEEATSAQDAAENKSAADVEKKESESSSDKKEKKKTKKKAAADKK